MLFGFYELTMKVVGVDNIIMHDKCDEFYFNYCLHPSYYR
jgi:hypothetical protein